MKACYGHSEGSAGAHGALLALSLLQYQAAAATMHLRNLNPYVEAAFADSSRACHAFTVPPRVRALTLPAQHALLQPASHHANLVTMLLQMLMTATPFASLVSILVLASCSCMTDFCVWMAGAGCGMQSADNLPQ